MYQIWKKSDEKQKKSYGPWTVENRRKNYENVVKKVHCFLITRKKNTFNKKTQIIKKIKRDQLYCSLP